MNNSQKIGIFRLVFKGRDDCYGAGEGLCVKQSLSDEVILSHLQGRRRIGKYPLSSVILDGSGTFWACVDIDNTDLNLAIEVVSRLDQLGIVGYVERSKSKGFHIWVFFTEPIQAKEARALMSYATNQSEFEIFPKQTTIKNGDHYGYGNYVNLPLFGDDVKNEKTVFLNVDEGYKPYTDQWAFLQGIERVYPQRVKDLIETGELEIGNDIAISDDTEVPEKTADDYVDMLPCVRRMMGGVSEGCRDQVCFVLAKHWRVEKGLPEEATLAILLNWNTRNNPAMEIRDIETKVKSAYQGRGGSGYTSFSCENALIEPYCEKENCPVFKEHQKSEGKQTKELKSPYFRGNTFIPSLLADDLMFDYSFLFAGQQLYVYQGGVYSPIGEDFIDMQCRAKLGEESRVNRVNEVIAHIKAFTRIKDDVLNRYTELINVENGMLDWRGGILLQHSQEYKSTIRIPVNYNPQARCDQVDLFLMSTLPLDCLYIAEELFGYCLIPDTRFETAFMLTGGGENGKSTFIKLLEAFIGYDNVSKVALQDLTDHRFMRADIYGKLVNLFADLDSKALQSTSYFKTVVSGDSITAERKCQDPFNFRPFCRLVYSANEIPRSPDRSPAYYRRWCIIEFPNRFVKGGNRDDRILEKMTSPEELSGLLNRGLKGLRRLFTQRYFTESETTKRKLDEYKRQNDTVTAFIADMCSLETEETVERTKLYDAYVQYCEREGYKPVSRQACYTRIRSLRISERKIDGFLHFYGIVLKG